MATNLNVKSGSFTSDTTITSPFHQSITGVGFTPKVVIFFSQGVLTSDGSSSSTKGVFSIGFTDGTNQGVAAWGGDGGVSTTAVQLVAQSDALAACFRGGTSSTADNPQIVSFDGDGFTLNYNGTPVVAEVIHYIALGGSDITNVAVGNQAMPGSATASSVTGLGFTPNFVMLISASVALGAVATANAHLSYGCAVSTTKRFAHALVVQNAQTMSANVNGVSIHRSDACLLGLTTGASVDYVADFTSFDSGGFTITFSTNTTTNPYLYLAIGGSNLNWDVTTAARPTTASAQSRTGLSFSPQVAWWSNSDLTTLNTITSNAALSIGHSDGGTSKSLYATHNDAINTVCGTNAGTNALQDGAPANSSGSASFTSFNSDGWTITWGATGAANQISSVSLAGTTIAGETAGEMVASTQYGSIQPYIEKVQIVDY